MDDLARKVERAAHNVEVVWDPARQRRVESRIESATTTNRWRRTAAFTLGAVAVMATVALALWPRGSSLVATPMASPIAAATHSTAPDTPGTLRLDDGSIVQALVPETRWVLERTEREQTSLRLEGGSARFEVVPADRVLVVLAGPAELRVMGTVFRVTMGAEAVTVAVERGSAKVRVYDRTHLLDAGDEASFTFTPPPVLEEAATPRPVANERSDGGGTARGRVGPRWDVLARDGDYEQAYVRLTQLGKQGVIDSPGDLLLAADTARLSGHAARAVDYLERFLERYATDPRAALTAFTLGRVQLQELGQPAKAANAFALVRRLAPKGELAEDALAREVESWSRAGRAQEALSLAEEYVRKYPAGRRLRMVRRLGGL